MGYFLKKSNFRERNPHLPGQLLKESLAKILHLYYQNLQGVNPMTAMAARKERKIGMTCQRCGGRMIFEKFYDVNNVFFGWHCVICGEILDAVILLHRLSRDADLHIPEEEQEVMLLLKKYLNAKNKDSKGSRKGRMGRMEQPSKGREILS
jgi:hypothetical protein